MTAPFVENIFFSPLYDLGFFVKNQVYIGVYIYVTFFDSISLVQPSVLCNTIIAFELILLYSL